MYKVKNIVLIGFRGSGKTTFGREIARQLRLPFADIDEEIEFVIGETVNEFVEKYGWQVFREVEQKVTHDFCRNFRGILATGGGTIENSKNLQNLKKDGVFVFLNPNFSQIKKYLLKDTTRPRIDPSIPLAQEIDQMWTHRKEIYRATADYECCPDLNGDTEAETKKIIDSLPANLFAAVPEKRKVVILSSSHGTTMQGILDAQKRGRIPNISFSLFLTDKPDAPSLEKAKQMNIENCEILEKESGQSREDYDRHVINILRGHQPDAILLAGWMRIFSPLYCDHFGDITYNVHPSLLPKHKGIMGDDIHEKVIEEEDKYTGATIHRIAAAVDEGETVIQRKVAVEPHYNIEDLKKHVQKQEILGFCELLERIRL